MDAAQQLDWGDHTDTKPHNVSQKSPSTIFTGPPQSSMPPTTSPHDTPPTSSSIPNPRIRRRNRMITSCLSCRQRKMRCDKSQPCTNCVRHNRQCVFLAPNLDAAAQMRLTEIKEKMGNLERKIEQSLSQQTTQNLDVEEDINDIRTLIRSEQYFGPDREDEKDLKPNPLAERDAVYDEDVVDDEMADLGVAIGKLRLNDRVGGLFRPKLDVELGNALRVKDSRSDSEKAADSLHPYFSSRPANIMAPGQSYIAPSASFVFSKDGADSSMLLYLPTRAMGDRLLSQYHVAVHPLIKLLHWPSFLVRYGQFWANVAMGVEPVPSLQAIVFTIFFSAVVTMSEEEVFMAFGTAKKELQDRFQQASEHALTAANFIRTSKLETIQAFTMYLVPMCTEQISRAHCALVGTVVRLAECMGLHRDGTNYPMMSSVEIEVRRSIWHNICFLDLKTTDQLGPRPIIRESDYDTKVPSNLNDDEIPATNGASEFANKFTDGTFARIRFECAEMHRYVHFARVQVEKGEMSLTSLLGKIESFKRVITARYMPLLDEHIPIHICAKTLLTIMIERLYVMVLHSYVLGSSKVPDRIRRLLVSASTVTLEQLIIFETNPVCKSWWWYRGAIHHFQIALLLLSQIWTRTGSPENQRIWKSLDYIFETPPGLSREGQARMIVNEIRDRIAIYQQFRKGRPSKSMLKGTNIIVSGVWNGNPVTFEDNPSEIEDVKHGKSLNDIQQSVFVNTTFDADKAGFPSQEAFARNLVDVGYLTQQSDFNESNSNGPSGSEATPESLLDVNWEEWDKLFPSTDVELL